MTSFGVQQSLVLALGAVFLIWLGVVLYVVATRAIYDARDAIVHRAQAVLERRVRGVLVSGTPARLDAILGRLPRRTVERVAADAATPDATARVFATLALERSHDRLLRNARARGRERTRWRRIAALRIFGRSRDPAALGLLEEALADRDDEVVAARATRSRVATRLDELDVDVSDRLRELCGEHEGEVRRWSAALLARYVRRREVTLDVVALTGDEDPSVRAAAVRALAGAPGPAALAAALALLEDEVWYVRAHAARTLGTLGRSEFAPALTRLLADEQWWVRTAAKQGLEHFGSGATTALLDALDDEDRFARNGASEVLQNTGELDVLVSAAARRPADPNTRAELQKVFDAGGPRLAEAALRRADSPSAEIEGLLQTVARGRPVAE